MTKTQTFEWEAVLAEATMNQAELTPLVPDEADDPAREAHSANAARLLDSSEQFDPAIGLQFLRARAYFAPTGRFSSLDPYARIPTDPQSLDKYRYARGIPIDH